MLDNCSKCSLYNLDNQFICDAQVISVNEEKASLALLDDYSEQLSTEVQVTFYDSIDGLITYLCTLYSYKEVVHPHYRSYFSVNCRFEEERGVIQRRRDIKVKTDFKIDISTKDADFHNITLEGCVRDISAGGLFFIAKEELVVGNEFSFPFQKGSVPLLLEGIILRRQKVPFQDRTGYGCRFIRLSVAKEAVIREFVFREQIHQKNA
ncbi:PilZ domain-containing protein [Parasporobacterium paucivorans]|uniref:PilZ domain-containing protein n=1 Tax=Parasporobacterium paucivorans DSM 15970 TaxID=1122934 RepID=A0A1M6I726_9FIRM|nr:PilZ domain-containing protein [Parasporobacterium paucivorans]SHJ30202.1 PilZ domain-containing protein [Parasporobacterium paucivorans DSM 15970]